MSDLVNSVEGVMCDCNNNRRLRSGHACAVSDHRPEGTLWLMFPVTGPQQTGTEVRQQHSSSSRVWRVEHFRSHHTLIFSILITFGVPFLMEKMEKKNLWDENLVLNGFKNDFSDLPMSLPSKRIFSAFFAFTNLDQTSY